MGKYDFDKLTDRRGLYSMKWDVEDDVLPMWVADMDFETAPAVKDALIRRAENGTFGYTVVPDEFFEAVSDFWYKRHNYRFDKSHMVYATGIVPAISSLVRKLTTPAEKVVIQTPVFDIFFKSIYNNGRYINESPLVYKDGGYEIDFSDLEEKLSDPQTTLMILCNPHNPVGKVWKKEELLRIGELCFKHGVTVISDEIHCEFTYPKKTYIPFASVSDVCRDISVTLVSASKSFNLAGLCSAVAIAHDPSLRWRVYRCLNTDEVGEPGAFAIQGTIAAFKDGEEWLDELIDYVESNKDYVCRYLEDNIPQIKPIRGDATYLMWLDISALGMDSKSFVHELHRSAGLLLSSGESYGECGRCFVRINLGTQRSRVEEGLRRLKLGVDMITRGD